MQLSTYSDYVQSAIINHTSTIIQLGYTADSIHSSKLYFIKNEHKDILVD